MSEQYAHSGVNILAGDSASAMAGKAAKTTFPNRRGKIGSPVSLPGGFAGVLDFGEYYIVQCCDTVGTKIDLAGQLNCFDQLGSDLLSMVCDDAVCLGAEVISLTNTFEMDQIDANKVEIMMDSLAQACREQDIVIAGGEIAEVGKKITGASWGADAIGIVEKEKIVTGEQIRVGDSVLVLQEEGFRCNGFSLIRKIISEHFSEDIDFQKKCLRKSHVYHAGILDICGRYTEDARAIVHGIAHVTGGGITGNIGRILHDSSLGVDLTDLFQPCDEMRICAERIHLDEREFYEVWNGGNGMFLISPPSEEAKIIKILAERNITAKKAGIVTNSGKIQIQTYTGREIIHERT